MKKRNKPGMYILVSIIITALYILTILSMRFTENKTTNLYQEYTELLTAVVKNPFNKDNLLKNFTNEIKMTYAEKTLFSLSVKMQKAVDFLTPGIRHCMSKAEPIECGTYTQEIIDASKERYEKMTELKLKPGKESIQFGKKYTTTSIVLTILILLIEGAIVTKITLWLMPTIKVKHD